MVIRPAKNTDTSSIAGLLPDLGYAAKAEDIAQRLNRLEQSGLVRRTPSPDDGRGTDVTLTLEGHAVIDRALPDHVATEQRMLAGLTAAQRTALAALLQQLGASLTETPPDSLTEATASRP